MIAAAFALAYFGYRGVHDVVQTMASAWKKTAQESADKPAQQVALLLNGTANRLFQKLAQTLDEPPEAGKCSVVPDTSPQESLVQVYAIYRQKPKGAMECMGPPARRNDSERKRLDKQIQTHEREFDWRGIGDELKYVHAGAEDLLFVASKHVAADGLTYFMVARLDLVQIRGHFVSELVRKLGYKFRVVPFNAETGRIFPDMVAGGPEPSTKERFLYEDIFSKELSAMKLRMAPKEEELADLEERLEWQKILFPLLVVMSTIIMALGMGIVMLSVVAERRASRMKSDFIANVSHELKTPLSLIRMFGEMVATGRHKGEDTAREYGSIITRESERLSHLIDNVLDFARLERGKASYAFAEGDLALVLERALDVVRYRLEKERLRLRTRVERNLPPVRMDENAITLVILNLVDNAIKYAVEGGAVDVDIERAPGGVVLSVRDYGPGIPAGEQGRIFERFYRAQSARDRNVRGSGIGLSLVHHIAEAHGGHVTVESPIRAVVDPGHGKNDGRNDGRHDGRHDEKTDGKSQPAAGGSVFRVFLPAPVVAGAESEPQRGALGAMMPGHVDDGRGATVPPPDLRRVKP
jgi:two-component system, OmpR family, phosphate regulon sensor histidine kinase PhoR